MRRKICLILALLLLVCYIRVPVYADKGGNEIVQQIKDTYTEATRQYGGSFYGYCNKYVDYQLKILGIDKSMIGKNGKEYWDYYKNKTKSTEGYSITAYPASNYSIKEALNLISANGTKNVYNIMVGFEVGSYGGVYGHVCFIHAIIGGKVYFSESYGGNFDGKYYSEGAPIIGSIDAFHNYYTSIYGYEGMIYFGQGNQKYYLDVNGRLYSGYEDGEYTDDTDIEHWGTCDVYINDSLVANDVTDFYQQFPKGTKYEIKDIKGVGLNRYYSAIGNLSGTIGDATVNVRLVFERIQMLSDTDPIYLKVGEGAWVDLYTVYGDKVDEIRAYTYDDKIATVPDTDVVYNASSTWVYIKGVKEGDTKLSVTYVKGYGTGILTIPVHVSGIQYDRYITVSDWDVVLERGVANDQSSTVVTVSCPGVNPGSYHLTYNTFGSDLIQVRLDDWVDDSVAMYLYPGGYSSSDETGTASIELEIWDDNNNRIDSAIVNVTVTDPYNLWFDGVYMIHRVTDGTWSGRAVTNFYGNAEQASDKPVYFTKNLWRIERQEDKTYLIRNLYDNSYLYPGEGFPENGCNVVTTYKYPENRFKRWAIKEHPAGGYYIYSSQVDSGLCLDIDNASMEIGANAQMWWENGTNAQSFDFDDWSSDITVPQEDFTPQTPDVWCTYDEQMGVARIQWSESPEVKLRGAFDTRAYEVIIGDLTDDVLLEPIITNSTEYYYGDLNPEHEYRARVRAVNREFDYNRVPYTSSGWAYTDFSVPQWSNPFVDVKEKDYFYDAVLWAFYHDPQITKGTDATHFGPGLTCMRQDIVTFLWRAYGCPEPTTTNNPFTDVAPSKYYYKAVLWAVENGITAGTSKTKFSPKQGCTRAEVVTFLWRANHKPEPTTTNNPFTDVAPSKYYYKAVLWAVENGITAGTSKTKFSPNDTCTRAQIVTFLYRALN